MSEKRTIIGDWCASIYTMGGKRTDWHLSISDDGTYKRVIRPENGEHIKENGTWQYHTNKSESIEFCPLAEDKPKSEWWILDLAGWEKVNTLLILRAVAIASRNLPIMFYRVYFDDNKNCERRTEKCMDFM